MDIFQNKVVKSELKRLHTLIGTDNGRDVLVDINLLKTALNKAQEVINGYTDMVTIDGNMWEEAHESLWKILNDIGLDISDKLSNFDCYEFAIVKSA